MRGSTTNYLERINCQVCITGGTAENVCIRYTNLNLLTGFLQLRKIADPALASFNYKLHRVGENWRVYDLNIKVCAPCAEEALGLGIAVEVLSGRKGKGNVEKISLDLRIVRSGVLTCCR